MGNKNEGLEQIGLHEDAEIIRIEESLYPNVTAFIEGLEACKTLHPDVTIHYRTEESSFVIALNESGADDAMASGEHALVLELLEEAAEHRRNPHIDVFVACEADLRRKLLGAFNTIDIYAKKFDGEIVDDQVVKSNETGVPFEFLGTTVKNPHDGRPGLFKGRTYRFSRPN